MYVCLYLSPATFHRASQSYRVTESSIVPFYHPHWFFICMLLINFVTKIQLFNLKMVPTEKGVRKYVREDSTVMLRLALVGNLVHTVLSWDITCKRKAVLRSSGSVTGIHTGVGSQCVTQRGGDVADHWENNASGMSRGRGCWTQCREGTEEKDWEVKGGLWNDSTNTKGTLRKAYLAPILEANRAQIPETSFSQGRCQYNWEDNKKLLAERASSCVLRHPFYTKTWNGKERLLGDRLVDYLSLVLPLAPGPVVENLWHLRCVCSFLLWLLSSRQDSGGNMKFIILSTLLMVAGEWLKILFCQVDLYSPGNEAVVLQWRGWAGGSGQDQDNLGNRKCANSSLLSIISCSIVSRTANILLWP